MTKSHYPKILINHVGFRPDAGKYVVIDGVRVADTSLKVVKMHQLGANPIFATPLVPAGNDLGDYLVGDMSGLHEPGIYRAYVMGQYPFMQKEGIMEVWSHDFIVDNRVWDEPLKKFVDYYRVQGCGASRQGYNRPCHTGKIQRDDGGEAVPIPGGWHSAHDGSRIVHETMHGLYGLLVLASVRPDLQTELDLLNEIRWGNEYFLAIQDQTGFLYKGVTLSREAFRNPVKHNWWDTSSYVLLTKPAPLYLQYHFSAIQALLAVLYRDGDPAYADRCLKAGIRCFECAGNPERREWTREKSSYELGTAISAAVHLFRATGHEPYRLFARKTANQLLVLQAPEGYWPEKEGSPFIATDPAIILDDHEPLVARTVYASLSVLGLVDAARWLKDDADRPRWVAALERFAGSYVKHFSEANAFGIMPCRAFTENPRQTSRHWEKIHYRYFMETNYSLWLNFCWQTGNNAIVAGYGVCMVYLSELLKAPELKKLAHRQLDWVLGVNPFDVSMITGVGRNQPSVYPATQMVPPIPDIAGAVLQGPIGDAEDNPVIIPGYYPIDEYWMPHQAWVLWLMAELSGGKI